MIKNNKTQKDVANALQVGQPTVSDWINAKKYPRIDCLQQIANYFGVYKSELIEVSKPFEDLDSANILNFKIDKRFYLILGSHLRGEREKRNKSLEEVANAIGLTKKTIQRYETGESRITVNNLKSICRYLDLDYEQFSKIVNREVDSNKKLRFIDCCFDFCELNPNAYENIDELENEIRNIVLILSEKYRIDRNCSKLKRR